MKKAIKVTLKLFSCLWAISLLGLLHITTVGYFLSRNMGYQYFNYLTYVLPMALLWLSMLIHFIGVGSIITIILMDLYLLYYGLNVLYETWIYFKPVFVTQDFWYIWKIISNQTIDAGLYLGSGVMSLVSIVGSIVYMMKQKGSLTFNIKAAKSNKESHQNPYGSAKLATPKDIKKFADQKGVTVGFTPKFPIDSKNLEKSIEKLKKQKRGKLLKLPTDHTVLVAPTRSGKGIGFIVTNILEWSGSLFVLDPKAELCCITKRYRESIGQKVYVFDPKNRSGLANCKINVLDFLPEDPEKKRAAIQELSKLICPQSSNDNSNSKHFSDSARSCIEWVLLYLCFSDCPKEDRHLGKAYEILTTDPGEFYETVKECSESNLAGGDLARAANIILTTAREEFSGVINTARNYLDYGKNPVNKTATLSSTITAQDLCDDKVDLFLCIELSDDGTPDKLAQLITRFVFRTIREDRNKTRNKDRLMILDELPALGYLGFVSQALVLGAGYGMKILAIFQSLEKLQTTYPNDWKTFLSSSLAVFMNCKDDEAEYVSNRVHTTTINVESESMGTSQQSKQGQINQNTSQQSGITQSMTHRNLLTKSEITSFGSDIVVAFYNECPPIICRRLNYLENKQFQGKFDDNPLHN
jgi:type IV secretory pathway TraG/TraD family ATPase VirD4